MKKSILISTIKKNTLWCFNKRSIIILILTFSIFKLGQAQDLIITKTGETISCKITNVDSTKIMFDFVKNGRTISTFIFIEEISDYKYDYRLKKASQWWFNTGLGICNVNSYGDYLVSFGINYSEHIKRGLISYRFIRNEEFILFGPRPSESVWDLGVLYGRFAKTSDGFASVSAGVSYVGGVRRGKFLSSSGWISNYEKLTFRTIGIPLEGQLFWTPTSFVGIGIYGFANMNLEKSFFGGLLCIQIGKIR
jgi:hypothetical protein